jgi:hypothetical protein
MISLQVSLNIHITSSLVNFSISFNIFSAIRAIFIEKSIHSVLHTNFLFIFVAASFDTKDMTGALSNKSETRLR